ncbi:MAG: V-type ATP synthase subunit D [Actinobacteria bacterium]|nr:V-type ATP synthase subunit D [Actinomycetota bacterium]
MAKIKKTKHELKAQREALDRFHRFLPTLELKKQQLQKEVRQVEAALRVSQQRETDVWAELRPWIRLLESTDLFAPYVRVSEVVTDTSNIAGVSVPVFRDVRFEEPAVDFFVTPAWHEEAVAVLRELTAVRAEQVVLSRQRDLLAEELRITSQRVNLFEKVMIPRTEENIRIIQIALGDAQTAAVARAKIAKGKSHELVSGATG